MRTLLLVMISVWLLATGCQRTESAPLVLAESAPMHVVAIQHANATDAVEREVGTQPVSLVQRRFAAPRDFDVVGKWGTRPGLEWIGIRVVRNADGALDAMVSTGGCMGSSKGKTSLRKFDDRIELDPPAWKYSGESLHVLYIIRIADEVVLAEEPFVKRLSTDPATALSEAEFGSRRILHRAE